MCINKHDCPELEDMNYNRIYNEIDVSNEYGLLSVSVIESEKVFIVNVEIPNDVIYPTHLRSR